MTTVPEQLADRTTDRTCSQLRYALGPVQFYYRRGVRSYAGHTITHEHNANLHRVRIVSALAHLLVTLWSLVHRPALPSPARTPDYLVMYTPRIDSTCP